MKTHHKQKGLHCTARPVARLGGAKYIFRGERFLFYYMLKTNCSGNNKIREVQKSWGELPPNAPRGYGPACCKLFDIMGCRRMASVEQGHKLLFATWISGLASFFTLAVEM